MEEFDRYEVENLVESMIRNLSLDIECNKSGIEIKLTYQGENMIHPQEIASDSVSWESVDLARGSRKE